MSDHVTNTPGNDDLSPVHPIGPSAQVTIRASAEKVVLLTVYPQTNLTNILELDPASARKIGVALISGAHQVDLGMGMPGKDQMSS